MIDTPLPQRYILWAELESAKEKIRVKAASAVAHFRRRIGATPPEVFSFCPAAGFAPIRTAASLTLITLPRSDSPTQPERVQRVGTVVRRAELCREHVLLSIELDYFPPTRPGQFVQLLCNDVSFDDSGEVEHDWRPGDRIELHGGELERRTAMLRRPFSLAGRRQRGDAAEIDIILRTVGAGTEWLATLSAGDAIDVLGPLGNAFTLPPAGGTALMVGGGVGIPPMIYLAERLARENVGGVAFCGATTRDLLSLTVTGDPREPALAEFAVHGIGSVVTTDDGSLGRKGFVTDALADHLAGLGDPSNTVIYTCGPEGMMLRVAELARWFNVRCQICVERAMACGMGTCQSCVIKVKKPDPALPPLAGSDWCYRLACTDGPVFAADQLLW